MSRSADSPASTSSTCACMIAPTLMPSARIVFDILRISSKLSGPPSSWGGSAGRAVAQAADILDATARDRSATTCPAISRTVASTSLRKLSGLWIRPLGCGERHHRRQVGQRVDHDVPPLLALLD